MTPLTATRTAKDAYDVRLHGLTMDELCALAVSLGRSVLINQTRYRNGGEPPILEILDPGAELLRRREQRLPQS